MRALWTATWFVLVAIGLAWSLSMTLSMMNAKDTLEATLGALGTCLLTLSAILLVIRLIRRLAHGWNGPHHDTVMRGFDRVKRREWVFVIALLSSVAAGCARVGPGYVGIKVSMAGSDRGVNDIPATTGWVFYNPFGSSVYEYPTFVQQVVWTQNPAEGRPANEEITFTNADQMQIAVDVSLAYHIEPDKVPAFYVKFRSDDLDSFTYGYLHSLARDKFNEIGGKYRIEQIMGDNGPFLKEVKASLQTDLTPIGVVLESQFGIIGAPRPPPAVIEAINMKVGAVQLAQQKQNEVVQAQADANKAVAKAEGDARSILAVATAQAEANRKIAESLSTNLIHYKELEKWDGKLPQVSGGSTPFVSLSMPEGK